MKQSVVRWRVLNKQPVQQLNGPQAVNSFNCEHVHTILGALGQVTKKCRGCKQSIITFDCLQCDYVVCKNCQPTKVRKNIYQDESSKCFEALQKQFYQNQIKKKSRSCITGLSPGVELSHRCKNCPTTLCNSCWKNQNNQKQKVEYQAQVAQVSQSSNQVTKSPQSSPASPAATEVLPNSGKCKICWDRPANFVNIFCGHICVCEQDAKKIQSCPLCRKYADFVQVFASFIRV